MSKHETEEIYDTQMAPLVAELIGIAKANDIPLVLSAGMIDPDGEVIGCTTVIPSKRPELAGPVNRHQLATKIFRGHSGFDTACGMVITRHHDNDIPNESTR